MKNPNQTGDITVTLKNLNERQINYTNTRSVFYPKVV